MKRAENGGWCMEHEEVLMWKGRALSSGI